METLLTITPAKHSAATKEQSHMCNTGDKGTQTVDEIDRLVQELWLESPGIGNKALLLQVQQQVPSTTRQRIKKAKALLPYHFTSSAQHHPQHDFVVQKLQERQSLRMEKRFEQADHIHTGLQAMGIVIDDVHKTWTVGEARIVNESKVSLVSSGVLCDMCGRYFASRNLVFKHLRDASSGCGTSIFASGQELEEAPSVKSKKTNKQLNSMPRAPGKTALHAPASHCVWLGDLPLLWTRPTGRNKRIRALLFAHLPNTIQEPWIKRVKRKAYRSKQSDEYLGYAIVVFRDEQEATAARELLDGMEVTADNTFQQMTNELQKLASFLLKGRPVEKGDTASAETAWSLTSGDSSDGGRDPPIKEQLRPLDLNELYRRIDLIESNPEPRETPTTDEALHHLQHQEALEKLVSLTPPRKAVHLLQGRPVPESLCAKLLEILQHLRWPARNERPRLTSERYLVLPTNVTNDRFYKDLRQACRALMDWADPDYYYSGIAVTKNFVASPHIDVKDQNYQYAVSLGDFTGGGQLCVEEWSDNDEEYVVNVVDTQNHMSRVDGRHVHWVRTWDTGDRYSLIFYDTSERNKSPAGAYCDRAGPI